MERIQAVNHHLRMALDQVSEGVMILESGPIVAPGPRLVYGNAAALRTCGVEAMDFYGVECGRLIAAESWPILSAALTDAAGGDTASAAVTLDTVRGPVPAHLKVQATRDLNAQVLNFIVTLRADVQAANPEPGPPSFADGAPLPAPDAWHADVIETIRETARYVAHEFNNALTGILLPVQLAIREVPRDGELHSRLQVAHESARRAADLAKDFLDCFRPRLPERERCQPTGLLGRAMRLATCGQNIDATLELSSHLHDIEVDQGQFERVIFNLVRNSSQAMPNGGRLRISARNVSLGGDSVDLPDGEYLQVSVRDWGPGIPPEHLKHLFHSRFTTKVDGNGCGLPICYQIVREHGGEMQVRSRTNVGTEFILYLPACLAPALPLPPVSVSDRPRTVTAAIPLPTPVRPALPVVTAPEPVAVAAPVLVSEPEGIPEPPPPAPPVPLAVSPLSVLPPLVDTVPLPPQADTAPVPSAVATRMPVPEISPLPPVSGKTTAIPFLAPLGQLPAASLPGPVPITQVPEPERPPTPPAAPAQKAPDQLEADEEPELTLLVVDDEDGVRRALSQIARIMGFEATTVGTSDEAIQIYRARLLAGRPFSSVLLDLNLRGGLNGVEVFQALRRMDPDALVVATSGQSSEADILRFRQLGFAGFLPKPYSLEDFDSVMREALAS